MDTYSKIIGNISAITETTLEVTVDASVTNENLQDNTVTLKGGEKDLVATYKANSLAQGKATFVLGGENKLADAVNYTAEADWANFTKADFVAKVAASTYIKTVEVSTVKVPANTAASDKNIVSFMAKDQYGDALAVTGKTADIKVNGTLNGVPLLASEVNKDNIGQGKIEINKDLAEGNAINLTFSNVIGGQTVEIGTASYTVAAAETSVPATILNMNPTYKVTANGHTKDTKVTELVPTDEITLTASVKDQFANSLTGSEAKVRWVIETGLENIDNSTADVDAIKATGALDADETLNLKVIKAGDVKVTAYLANGEKLSYEITVGASKLAAFTVPNIVGNNNEETTSTEITGTTSGAILNASDIKFAITELPEGATANDITLTAVNGTTDDTKNKIYVKATTLKAGTYKFKTYVGTAIDDANAIVANAGVVSTVTTQVNQTVASMEVETIGENELTAGAEVKKAVTFKNKHGEVVSVKAKDITVAKTGNMTVTAYDTDDQALIIGTAETAITKLGFSGAAEGVDTVTIVTGSVSKQIQTTTIKAAGLNNIEIANAAAVINGDIFNGEDNDLKVVEGGLTYTLVPITFKDQYGNKIDVAANTTGLAVTGTDANYKTAFFKAGDDDAARTKVTDETAVAYIGFAATELTDADLPTTKELTITNGAETPITAKVTVTANKARVLDALTVTPEAGNSVVGAKKTFTLSGIDQYGVAVDLDEANVKLVALDHVAIADQGENAEDAKKADFTLSADAAGNYTAKVYYDNGSTPDTLETSEKSLDIAFTANEIGDAINSLVIEDTVPAQLIENTSNTIKLNVKALDTNEQEVSFQDSDLIWTVKTVDVTGTTVNLEANKVTVANGTVTVDLTGVNEDVKGTIVIKASTLNGKVAEKTINVNSADSVAQAGTYYLAKSDATDKAITSITLDKDDANGVEEVVLVAKDQYGKKVNLTENAANIVLGQDSSSFFTKAADTDSINVTAKAVGSSTLRVFVNGNQEATLTITADQAAVDATK